MEVLSYAEIRVLVKSNDVFGRTSDMQAMVLEDPFADPQWIVRQNRLPGINHSVPHPYLGFVRAPEDSSVTFGDEEPMKGYGFSTGSIVRQAKPDTVTVGVFGGSVAYEMMNDGAAAARLTDGFHRIPAFHGKRIVYTVGALPGYKQPQSLMALAYFLSIGAHFDVVVLLDGFNDVAWGMVHPPKEIFPLYPWNAFYLPAQSDPGHLAGVTSWLGLRELIVHTAIAPPLRWSATVRLLWLAVDQTLQRRIALLEAKVSRSGTRASYALSGPELPEGKSDHERQTLMADTWKRSSLQMRHLAETNGALYFHFLQPNQYVKDSKPMGGAERHVAISTGMPYGPLVVSGYPLLQSRGAELRSGGENFSDLTGVFRDHREPLYIDEVCHVSSSGSVILADAIGETAAASIK